jgi:predicted  nucleic acid-binding Zn-ribbon protein
MVQLQKIYNRVTATITEWKTAPPEVQELKEANRRRQTELEELEARVEAFEEECREVRKKEEEWKMELEHFQRQKSLVTNEREFTAVISEIDYATKALEESSERRTELEAGITETTDDIEARRKARPEEEEAQKSVVEAWEQRRADLKQKVHDLAAEAKDIESRLQPKARARFLRLLESKRGTAIAEVVEGSCSLCHFALRPHLQQRVRRVHEIISCEHCHRILFFADVIEAGGSSGGDQTTAD